MTELKTLYLVMLERLMSIEDQLIAHLPLLIEQATSTDLREGLSHHLEETRGHKKRIEEIFSRHNYGPTAGQDLSMQQMISDTEAELGNITDPYLRDAFIIASGQTVEHIEIAKYGTVAAWADELDLDEDADILGQTLDEEEKANDVLTGVAEGGIFTSGVNEKAA